MANTILMQNPDTIHVGFKTGTMFPEVMSHPFTYLSLPRKTQISSSSSEAAISYRQSVTRPTTSTTKQNILNQTTSTTKQNILNHTSSSSSNTSSLAHFWREIQGLNSWENLVDPFHPLLREEIIRYGEFVASTYKAFDMDPNSTRFLKCKYGKKSLLEESGIQDSGYEVTKYIYATSDFNVPTQNEPSPSRWIGYVAVSSSEETINKLGRRDILISFRGTITISEWIANLMSSLTPARLDPCNPRPEVKVESGFLSLYTSEESTSKFGLESCREQLLSEVSRLVNKYKGEELSITLAGHSMGSALALLLAYDISELGLYHGKIPVTVFSFGGPRVGNLGFKKRCEELGVKVLRITNVNDPITKLPGVLLNENFRVFGGKYELPWSRSCYAHVGVELVLDFFSVQNPAFVHDLEAYIDLLKLPSRREIKFERSVLYFLCIAKEMIVSGVETLNSPPWINTETW